MLKKIYQKLVTIEMELKTIRKCLKAENITINISKCDFGNLNKKTTKNQQRDKKTNTEETQEMLKKIDEAILEMYKAIKQNGKIASGINEVFDQISFEKPNLALHIKKRMMQIASGKGDLP